MKILNLKKNYSFKKALTKLLNGECLGIRPNNNSNYIKLHKPNWMNKESPDFMLIWDSGEKGIRSNMYFEKWQLVVVDHREIEPEKQEVQTKKPDAAVGITQRGQIVFSSDIEEPEEELVITTFANFKNGDKIYYATDGAISVKSGDVKIDQKNVSNMYFHVLNSDLDESVQFKVETNSDYDVSKDVSFYAYEDKYHEM